MSRLSDVNQFVAASRNARRASDLSALMESITREMGFHHFALVRHVREFKPVRNLYSINNYPRHWIDYYLSSNLRARDPVLLASFRSLVGFRFDEIPALIELTEGGRDVFLEARRRAGLTDGFCVPAHIPGEVDASCTFIVCAGAPLPAKNLSMAQLVGGFAHEAARRLLSGGSEGPRPAAGALTPRQLECILLVGRGKTDWEIARLLGISEDTVTDHINDARRRYGVGRRAELPVQALYRGDLSFSDLF